MRFSYPEFSDETKQAAATETVTSSPQPATPPPLPTGKEEIPEGPLAKICTVAGWILVPLFMPVIGIALIFTLSAYSQIPLASKWIVALVVTGLNTALPMALIYALKALGVVHDVGLNDRKERLYPYIITIVGLCLTAVYLYAADAPRWIWAFYIGAAITAGISLIINSWWKISAHAGGIAGIVALLTVMARMGGTPVNMTWWIVGAIIVAGLLGSARVYMYRHTPLQVIAGYIVGFFPAFLLAIH